MEQEDSMLKDYHKDVVTDNEKFGYHQKCYQSCTNIKNLKFKNWHQQLETDSIRRSSRNRETPGK